MQFFNDWALWEKMTFVLACAIVCTIGAGLMKLWFDTRQLKKYAAKEAIQKAATPNMVESRMLSDEEKGDIPFGIRAIEKGWEVEGVWLSAPNTPVPGSPVSSAQSSTPHSPMAGPSSRPISDIPKLDLPKPRRNDRADLPSQASSVKSQSTFDRAVSAEPIYTRSRDPSPGPAYAMSGARPHQPPPPAMARYNGLLRDSMTLDALEGREVRPVSLQESAYDSDLTKPSSSGSGKSSDESSKWLDETTQDSAAYLVAQRRKTADLAMVAKARVKSMNDLDMLQSHRLSHVAETGQLTPRSRRPFAPPRMSQQNDSDRSSAAGSGSGSGSDSVQDLGDYFSLQPRHPPPKAMPAHSPSNPFITPRTNGQTPLYSPNTELTADNRASMPLLHFQDPSPQDEIDILSIQGTQDSKSMRSYTPTGVPRAPPRVMSPHFVATPQNQREGQVVRKVNSGFEILAPGTFPQQTPTVTDEDLKIEGKRLSKKLQKKRRPSEASNRNSVG